MKCLDCKKIVDSEDDEITRLVIETGDVDMIVQYAKAKADAMLAVMRSYRRCRFAWPDED